MPDKHEATERWGGPGASHEDRSKPKPPDKAGSATAPDHADNRSHVSGGGGEGDKHHTHAPEKKGS